MGNIFSFTHFFLKIFIYATNGKGEAVLLFFLLSLPVLQFPDPQPCLQFLQVDFQTPLGSSLLAYSWTRKSAYRSSHLVSLRPPLGCRLRYCTWRRAWYFTKVIALRLVSTGADLLLPGTSFDSCCGNWKGDNYASSAVNVLRENLIKELRNMTRIHQTYIS